MQTHSEMDEREDKRRAFKLPSFSSNAKRRQVVSSLAFRSSKAEAALTKRRSVTPSSSSSSSVAALAKPLTAPVDADVQLLGEIGDTLSSQFLDNFDEEEKEEKEEEKEESKEWRSAEEEHSERLALAVRKLDDQVKAGLLDRCAEKLLTCAPMRETILDAIINLLAHDMRQSLDLVYAHRITACALDLLDNKDWEVARRAWNVLLNIVSTKGIGTHPLTSNWEALTAKIGASLVAHRAEIVGLVASQSIVFDSLSNLVVILRLAPPMATNRIIEAVAPLAAHCHGALKLVLSNPTTHPLAAECYWAALERVTVSTALTSSPLSPSTMETMRVLVTATIDLVAGHRNLEVVAKLTAWPRLGDFLRLTMCALAHECKRRDTYHYATKIIDALGLLVRVDVNVCRFAVTQLPLVETLRALSSSSQILRDVALSCIADIAIGARLDAPLISVLVQKRIHDYACSLGEYARRNSDSASNFFHILGAVYAHRPDLISSFDQVDVVARLRDSENEEVARMATEFAETFLGDHE